MFHREPSVWKLPAVAGGLWFLALYSGLLVPSLVMMVPLLLWLDLSPGASRTRRLWGGFLMGVACYAPALHFHWAMAEYSWLAWVLWAGNIVAFSLKVAVAVALLGWLRSRLGASFAWLLPAVWVSVEWLQTWGDLRMTADHAGHTLAAFPFVVQFADLLGTYGVSAALYAFNGLLYEMLYALYADRRRRAAVALAVLTATVLVYDGWAWYSRGREVAAAPTLPVGLIQPNIPIQVKNSTHTAVEQWRVLERLTGEAAAAGARTVVWPESARPWPLFHETNRPQSYRMPDVESLVDSLGVSIVVGAEYARGTRDTNFDYYNAAFLMHADGTLDEAWGAKVYLVPFTEGGPFRPLLGPLIEGRGGEWDWMAGGFEPGPGWPLLPLRRDGETVTLGVVVCYEQLFYEPARSLRNAGAGLLAVITNDAWFGRSLFQNLQRDVLRMRAIENRTSVVRVANTGYSGFVDPLGRYAGATALFEEAVEVHDVALAGNVTLYDRVGNVVAWLALAGLAVSIATALAGGKKGG